MGTDALSMAKDIATLAAAGAVFIGALRVARQSKQMTDDIRKGSQAYTDVRGNQDSESDRERRGLLGDMAYLLGRRNDSENGGIVRELTRRVERLTRKNDKLESSMDHILAWLRVRGEDRVVHVIEQELEDTGNRRIITSPGVPVFTSKRNTPRGSDGGGG